MCVRIADLETSQRPRERLAVRGAEALADRELLAILLGTGGTLGVGAHTLAERVLARFGSVAAVARASLSDLISVSGVGTAKASTIVAALELARRAERPEPTPRIQSTAGIAKLVAPYFAGRTRERLVVVVCDQANRVRGCDIISEGAVDSAPAPIREILTAVLRRDGKAFALAHNHPSGDPTPSSADITATHRLRASAEALGLRLVDHIVVGGRDWRRVAESQPPTERCINS
jgi:DNA repair protein RadC